LPGAARHFQVTSIAKKCAKTWRGAAAYSHDHLRRESQAESMA